MAAAAAGGTAAAAARSKGERLLQQASAPVVCGELPLALRQQAVLSFDVQRHGLRTAAAALLRRAPGIGRFEGSGEDMERFRTDDTIFRSFGARQQLRQLVIDDEHFLGVYEQLVLEVVVPWLQARLAAELPDDSTRCFSYQFPPTLRIQPGPSEEFKRPHRDAEYGHQIGEINFWMPLTSYDATQATLWVESCPGVGDFQPLAINYGSIAAFHGTLCRHHVPANKSECTRISLDFRIGVGDFFDPDWQLDGVKGVHGRKEVTL